MIADGGSIMLSRIACDIPARLIVVFPPFLIHTIAMLPAAADYRLQHIFSASRWNLCVVAALLGLD
jgi:hypothetical protein